jgi:tetratricopeptide (TPR) repeat protein
LQRYDSTVAELQIALDTLRRREATALVPIYTSKEMFEYAIGMAQVQTGNYAAGRAAFARALVENLGFYMAHARLAGVALEEHDTATALSELDLATQVAPRDPAMRFYDGFLLLGAKRYDEAAAQFSAAVALDSFYAAPYFWSGRLEDTRGRVDEAVRWYRGFLARAEATSRDRLTAERRIGALTGQQGDTR